MKSWELEILDPPNEPVNAPELDLGRFCGLNQRYIERLCIGEQQIAIGDLFKVRVLHTRQPTLRIVGDGGFLNQIGRHHSEGRLEIDGSIGDHAFASMSGGDAYVRGDAGNFLAAPVGNERIGMTGGRVVIADDVGERCGHRMRRGHVWVAGNAGDGLASFMIAGTIVVAGDSGDAALLGYGMNRGTIVLSRHPKLSPDRFSLPRPIRSPAITLLAKSLASHDEGLESIRSLSSRFSDAAICSRGDMAVSGQAEVLTPA